MKETVFLPVVFIKKRKNSHKSKAFAVFREFGISVSVQNGNIVLKNIPLRLIGYICDFMEIIGYERLKLSYSFESKLYPKK